MKIEYNSHQYHHTILKHNVVQYGKFIGYKEGISLETGNPMNPQYGKWYICHDCQIKWFEDVPEDIDLKKELESYKLPNKNI